MSSYSYIYFTINYIFVAVSKILSAVTEYITQEKLGYVIAALCEEKVFWLVINSNNRSDGISLKTLGKTNSDMAFTEDSSWHIG